MSPLLVLLGCASPDLSGSEGALLPRDLVLGQPSVQDPADWLAPHWEHTVALCQPPQPFVMEAAFGGRPSMSEACVLAVGEDLGLSRALLDDYSASYELLSSAFFLLGYDLGTVDHALARTDPQGRHYLREPFRSAVLDIALELDHDLLAGVLYDLVASVILTSEVGELDGADASFDRSSRHLVFDADFGWSGFGGAFVLVHEAAHGWTGKGHVACPPDTVLGGTDLSGQPNCDTGWDGAFSFSGAAALLLGEGIPPEEADQAAAWYQDEAAEGLDASDVLIISPTSLTHPHRQR